MVERYLGSLLAISLSLCSVGCQPPSADAPRRQIMPDLRGRTVCGWDELMGDEPDLSLDASGAGSVAPGARVISLRIAPEVPHAVLERALQPAGGTLVRVKLVLDDRWLLPVTIPAKVQPPKPKPEDAQTSTVGYRKITRDKKAPRERFADLRLTGDRVQLYVENEAPGGTEVALSALADTLRAQQPPIGVVAVTASDDTRWAQLSRAIIAAACFDRAAGDEPHEVLLD